MYFVANFSAFYLTPYNFFIFLNTYSNLLKETLIKSRAQMGERIFRKFT